MTKTRAAGAVPALLAVLLLVACGGDATRQDSDDGSSDVAQAGSPAANDAADAGTDSEALAREIGPIRDIEIGAIQEELAERGEEVFTIKCSACHKLDERYVGPPLQDVTERRSPVFVMNMILNPAEMVERHPEVKALLAQYYTPMPNQNLTEDEARAVLEYLRSAAASRVDTEDGEVEKEGEVEE